MTTSWDLLGSDGKLHKIVREWSAALDATLSSKAAMSFYNLVVRDTSLAVETVYVLGEMFQKQAFVVKESDEAV